MQAKLRNEEGREKGRLDICSFLGEGHIDCPLVSRGFAQPAMTATADATDSSTVTELAQTVENLKETVETQAKQISKLEKTVDQQSERIEQLEAQPENELIEVKSEGDTSGLMDIWIVGIPLGSILQKTTEDVDRAHNRLDEVKKVTSNNGTPG